jgi:predicted O-methyltransferase YrrM
MIDYLARGAGSDIAAHLDRLHSEASRPGVKVLELGVRTGNSTAAFLAAAEANDGHVWSIDITSPAVPPEWQQTGLWTLTVGDDLELAPQAPDKVDVLFIDTSHTYSQTYAELAAYARNVKPGGVILLHDTELEHPQASPPTDPPFPVAQAIKDWNDGRYPIEWVTGCYGLAVIRMEDK